MSLEQTETLFRALLDLLPDAVVVLDPNDPDGLGPSSTAMRPPVG